MKVDGDTIDFIWPQDILTCKYFTEEKVKW